MIRLIVLAIVEHTISIALRHAADNAGWANNFKATSDKDFQHANVRAVEPSYMKDRTNTTNRKRKENLNSSLLDQYWRHFRNNTTQQQQQQQEVGHDLFSFSFSNNKTWEGIGPTKGETKDMKHVQLWSGGQKKETENKMEMEMEKQQHAERQTTGDLEKK